MLRHCGGMAYAADSKSAARKGLWVRVPPVLPMLKHCGKCNNHKSIDDFSFKNKKKNIRQNMCKSCHKNYMKEHYTNNKLSYKEKATLSNIKYISRNRDWVSEFKQDKPCADCGNTYHPCAMDFDHINDDKIDSISKMMNQAVSIDTIISEIQKCELVCAVCHRIRTYNRLNNLP